MSSFDHSLSGLASLRAVNEWIGVINSNLGGSNRTAYKSTKISFGGGVTNIRRDPAQGISGIQIPDSTLSIQSTSIDFSQGAILKSDSPNHLAISGKGFFMVTDQSGSIFYTRDGDFHYDGKGNFINSQGLIFIDPSLAVNMGLYYIPPASVTNINTGNTGWSTMGNNQWYPYVAGTIYDEGGGWGYTSMSILAKRSFFVDASQLTGTETLTISSDDQGYVVVNGNLITAADVISGPYPGAWFSNTVLNIGPYLQNGLNTIIMKVSEGGIGERAAVVGSTVPGVNISTGNFSTWVTKVIPFNPVAPTITDLATANAINTQDVVLALPEPEQSLKFTKYGSTIFSADRVPNSFYIGKTGTDNLGDVQNYALESSNNSLNDTLPELSLAQKMFSAVSKIINVCNTNLDITLNFVK